jgi:hypothetical protein
MVLRGHQGHTAAATPWTCYSCIHQFCKPGVIGTLALGFCPAPSNPMCDPLPSCVLPHTVPQRGGVQEPGALYCPPLYRRLHPPVPWVLDALEEAGQKVADWMDRQQSGFGTTCR